MEDKSEPKNYLDILENLFVANALTKKEYAELKENYEHNLQKYSQSAY